MKFAFRLITLDKDFNQPWVTLTQKIFAHGCTVDIKCETLLFCSVKNAWRIFNSKKLIMCKIECPLFSQSYLINLPDWSTLDIAPRVNWVKFGSIWVKIVVAPSRAKITKFYYINCLINCPKIERFDKNWILGLVWLT